MLFLEVPIGVDLDAKEIHAEISEAKVSHECKRLAVGSRNGSLTIPDMCPHGNCRS